MIQTHAAVVVSQATISLLWPTGTKRKLDSVFLFNFDNETRDERTGPLCVPGGHTGIICDETKSECARKLINSRGALWRAAVYACVIYANVETRARLSRTAAKLTEIHCVVVGRARETIVISFAIARYTVQHRQKCERVIPYHVTQTDGRIACYREIYSGSGVSRRVPLNTTE